MLDALIVGGGVAGLEAALTLVANGPSVRLLEASERVGAPSRRACAAAFEPSLAPRPYAPMEPCSRRAVDFDLPLQRAGAGSARRKGVLTSAGLTYLAPG